MKNSITDKIKTLEDVYKEAQATKEELEILSYTGTNKRILGSKSFLQAEMIAEVLNEKSTNNYWFGYYKPGFGFRSSTCISWSSRSAVSSRLRFASEELFYYSVKIFPEVYKDLMEKN